ncbi:hypothetical protein H2Y56_22085 [Pectobacterium aroidearum]|uniref:Uncharacterized protein n=1 Tax=Pectobacterium aroidearum TaxID=1201031 RepID=A0ABR5ZJN0_9GAMM|nr:hypothetical protein [Pectobacterium aroidearum]MBA5234774.1 hypothetical protein [Pectobacterium aroidearum]MBA5739953.1 hypothetical protein [Pectobacterium aroidearum]
MNYKDVKGLRKDVAALNDQMTELQLALSTSSRRYYWGSENLTERIAGQIINEIQEEMAKLGRKLNELNHHFKD